MAPDRRGKIPGGFCCLENAGIPMSEARRTSSTVELPHAPETYLKDALADSLARYAERLPEAKELLAALGAGAEGGKPARIAVRGLTGSARAFLASWLQRASGRTVLCVVAHGEAFDEASDDVEYFRGPGSTLAFPEPETLPYDPSSPHPGITAQRLETLGRLAAAHGGAGGAAWSGVVLATARGLLQKVPA